MAEARPIVRSATPAARSATPAGFILGGKLDSIPFSPYHLVVIAVLGLVGFVDGYDLVVTGIAPRAGERATAPHPGRNPLSRRRLDVDDLRRRLYRLGDLRSFQPQDHHADRRRLDHLFDLADPAGAERRAADRRPPARPAWAEVLPSRRRFRSPPN